MFLDYTIFACVMFLYLQYQSLSIRAIKLLKYSYYGEQHVLEADLRLKYEDLQLACRIRIHPQLRRRLANYIWRGALQRRRSGRRRNDNMYHLLTEQRAGLDLQYAHRMGILYTKYKLHCWWGRSSSCGVSYCSCVCLCSSIRARYSRSGPASSSRSPP